MIEQGLRKSLCFPDEFVSSKSDHIFTERGQILVIRGDCVDVALWLKNNKKTNPVILNMANRNNVVFLNFFLKKRRFHSRRRL
jgi:hypothetical protein